MEELFLKWLESKNLSKETLRDYMKAISDLKLLKCDCDTECIKLAILRVKTSKHIRVLQNYISYCSYFEEKLDVASERRLRKILNIKNRKSHRLVQPVNISLSDVMNLDEKVKPYLLFAFFSGIRMKEVFEVKSLCKKEKATEYLNGYSFLALNKDRVSKIATFAFAPTWVFEELCKARELSYYTITRLGLSKKMRKNWYQKCVQATNYPQICKFMQGRVGDLGVSEIHYLDLLEKSKQLYPLVVMALQDKLHENVKYVELLLGLLRYSRFDLHKI